MQSLHIITIQVIHDVVYMHPIAKGTLYMLYCFAYYGYKKNSTLEKMTCVLMRQPYPA